MIIIGIDTAIRKTGYGVIDMRTGGSIQILDCGLIRNASSLPRILFRRKLYYPVFEPFWKIPVAEKKLVAFAVPANKRLRLRAAYGRTNPNDCSQRLFAVEILKLAVYSSAGGIYELSHLERGRTSTRTMVGLVA